MIIRVIGMKSAQSNKFAELVRAVMKELGINAAVEEINELNKMLKSRQKLAGSNGQREGCLRGRDSRYR